MRPVIACVAVALLGALVAGAPALAQEAPREATAVPTQRQLDLTRRYIVLMMSDQFEDTIREMVGDQAETDRSLSDPDRQFLVDLTAELTTDMLPQMIDQMVPVYAAAFTEAELEALVAFYDSELGRSIAAKSVQVMPEANRAVMSVVPRMLEKMAARICQHYGCEPGELDALRRSMREGLNGGGAPAEAPAPKAGSRR